ncbi:MAG: gliding motility-associated C-terminal domain-containing protein [Saprospiraceae bacterium]
MKKPLYRLFSLFVLMQFAMAAFATHNRAGEIVVEQIGGCTSNTVRATVYTWTKASSFAADRDSVTICWGDNGPCDIVPRANGNGQQLPNDVKYNFYVAEHTYDGPGRYIVSMTDPNRNGGILNVNPPGSENVQFHLQTTFTLFSGQSQGCNSSPFLLNPPIDYACSGELFAHNPGAYDVDGDSLSYELIVPLQDVNTPVPNYIWPPNVQNQGGSLTINAVTGTLEWFVPTTLGEYNIAIIIISWRNGMAIDTTVRDIQVIVYDCDDNHAPEIQAPVEICVIAGEVVQFNVVATDPDVGDQIKLSALGAPFGLAVSPADNEEDWRPIGNPSATYEDQPVEKIFRWQTVCEHISDLHYTVVFKAEDDYFLQPVDNSTGLASIKAVRIKVVGPPPLDVQAEPSSDRITVSWELPYMCEDAADDFFLSFSVWRKEGNDNFIVDKCRPGLDGAGYTWLGNTRAQMNGRYQWVDMDVERGRTYCYRILARFAKRTDTGQAYNIVESLASDKVCVQLSREVPLITKVSIDETSTADGQIQVEWIKPVAEDLDTLLNPPPYKIELIRTQGLQGGGSDIINTFFAQSYTDLDNINAHLDNSPNTNTQDSPYTYELAFYVNNEPAPLGFSPSTSSVFLEIAPTDNQNNLSWKFDVPWVNYEYDIFRQNNLGGWDSLTTVQDTFYADTGLLNGKEYCYYIRAYGSYGIQGVPAPLINLSQEACAVPIDNVAPCPPELIVTNICDENRTCEEGEILENYLSWINPMELCEETDDVVGYNIYFSPTNEGDLLLIGAIDDSGTVTYEHQPDRGIAGCYAVTALDTFANESVFSNIFCVDNCPNYSLPNTFTPNGDGRNDFYMPYPFCFIENVEFNIFNRWGQLVYETRDPNINWSGENMSGQELPAGTYYYTCKVFEQRVTGIVEAPDLLNGYIDLIR